MIKLVEFNDKWKSFFIKEKEILLSILKGQRIMEVEHIGATSVVLCKTCGTIDLMCTIYSKIDFETIKNILVNRGYQYLKSMSNDDCYTFARRNENRHIVATVRVVEQASLIHQQIVLFKGYLREKDKHVRNYNQFRQTLLLNCGGNAKIYQQTKRNYINSILNDYCRVK